MFYLFNREIASYSATLTESDKDIIKRAVSTTESNDRRAKLMMIEELAAHGQEHLGVLTGLLKHHDEAVRVMATTAISKMGTPHNARFLPALLETLERIASPPGWELSDYDEGGSLSQAFATMGEPAALPLTKELRSKYPAARATAALALGNLAREVKTDISEFVPGVVPRKAIPLSDEAIAHLITSLEDDYAPMRRSSVYALMTVPPDSKHRARVVGLIIKRLEDPEERVWTMALAAVSEFGPQAAPALNRLSDMFQKEEYLDRQDFVANAISALGETAAPAVPMLAKALRDDRPEVRANAVIALSGIGTKVEGVLPALHLAAKDPVEMIRQEAEQAIGSSEVGELVARLDDPDPKVKRSAVTILSSMGPAAEPALPRLIALLRDPDEMIAEIAVQAIAEVGTPALPALTEPLEHGDRLIRLRAVEAIIQLGLLASPVVGRLEILRSNDPDPEVRRHSAIALAGLQPRKPESPATLARALGDYQRAKDVLALKTAERVILKLGKLKTESSVRALAQILLWLGDDPKSNGPGRRTIVEELKKAGPVGLPILLELFDNPDVHQPSIASALGGLGAIALPALIDALGSKAATRRADVALAIGWATRQDPWKGSKAIVALMDVLNDPSPEVRRCAVEALETIGPASRRATKQLLLLMADSDPGVADAATSALTLVGPDAKEVVPLLIERLTGPEQLVRKRTARVLAKLGRPAVQPLLKLVKEGDHMARYSAMQTLVEMSSQAWPGTTEDETAQVMADALRDDDPRINEGAVRVLSSLGSKALMVETTLIDILGRTSSSASSRRAAALTLCNLAPRTNIALLKGLENPDATIREAVVLALSYKKWDVMPVSEEAIIPLTSALQDESALTRSAAALVLGRLAVVGDPDGREEVVQKLTAMLNDSNAQVRRAACAAIEEFRSEARPALNALIACLDDMDEGVRQSAEKALVSLGRRAVIPLSKCLNSQNTQIRVAAARSLGKLRFSSEIWLRIFEDPDPRVGREILEPLRCLNGADLDRFQDSAPVWREAFLRGIKNRNVEVRRLCANALVFRGADVVGEKEEVVEALIYALLDPDAEVREGAALTLSQLGARALGAVPALRETSHDPIDVVREAARKALTTLDP